MTWCEHQYVEPYACDWRIDPCLVIVIYPENQLHQLFVRSEGEITVFEGRDGDAFLIPAGVSHRFDCPTTEIIGVNIQYTLFDGIDMLSFYHTPHIVRSAQAERLIGPIDSLVTLIGQPSWYAGESMSGQDQINLLRIVKERQFVFELLGKVLDLSEIRPHGEKRLLLLHKLKPALEYIEDKLEEKVSVDTLGENCGLSAHRFSALFKDILGVPPHQYILKRRMEKAMSILSHTDFTVADVASQLGFHDQSHFTKLFKIATGLSPTYYRKDILRRLAKGKRGN